MATEKPKDKEKPGKLAGFDLAAMQLRIKAQFLGLDFKDPSSWPLVPRLAVLASVTAVVVVVLWLLLIGAYAVELETEQGKETTLREAYKKKYAQAANLDALRKQREQVLQFVNQLERQLPSKAEMDALLTDVNQAGLGRSLNFELFRPGSVAVKNYYAELPIALKVNGKFHDIGAFTADVANLSRIVTLNNLVITPGKDGVLSLEATAKTFRYLDPEEVTAQQKAASGAKKK